MGYFTDYQISTDETSAENKVEYELALRDIVGADINLEFFETRRLKWYDWRDDMLKLSSFYPDVVFRVQGIGEARHDMWRAVFKSGKCNECQAEIVWPELSIPG